MPLASYENANGHLDESKIKFVDDADAEKEAESAFNEIASRIGRIWPTQLPTWDFSPGVGEEQTPSVVRYIASLLMASFKYAKHYSEEEIETNEYADRLERRAINLLEALVAGTITLWDKAYGEVIFDEARFNQDDFWPNDTYTEGYVKTQRDNAEIEPDLQPARRFAMDMEL